MAISKDKKVSILGKLNEALRNAETTVFVNFRGLSVALATELRRLLHAQNVGYLVVKKTLLRRALSESKAVGDVPALDGEIAIAYSTDQIAPAKGVYAFQKKNPDLLKIVGGIFEGKYLDEAGMTAVASIPDRPVLYGQFVHLINWPIQGLVVALDQIAAQRTN